VVHVRLAWLPDDIGGYPATAGRWCGYGAPYVPEATTAVNGLIAASDVLRLAQAAQLLSKAADACAPYDPPVTPSPSEPTPSAS
jgi:hypothetical protein